MTSSEQPQAPTSARSWLPVPCRLEVVACPLCGSDAHEQLLRHDAFGFPTGLRACRDCHLLYVAPRPTFDFMDRFYRRDYRRFYDGISAVSEDYVRRRGWHETARTRLERYERFLPRGGRLLDVGCGAGLFAALARDDRGLAAIGLEPDPAMRDWAGRELGLEVCAGSFGDGSVEGRFDVVSAFHVVEHLHDQAAFFGFVRRHLEPGGVLLVEVPDVEGPWRDIGMFHIAHLFAFSPSTLRAMAARHGFEAVELGSRVDPNGAQCVSAVFRDTGAAAPLIGDPLDQEVRRRIGALPRDRGYRVLRNLAKQGLTLARGGVTRRS